MTNAHRLPTTVRPRHYDIGLDLDLDGERFSGSVAIDVDVVTATSELVLNADQLDIEGVQVTVDDPTGGAATTVGATVAVDAENERIVIATERSLAPGPAWVRLDFGGAFSEKLVGLYLSRFTDSDGTEHRLATTQFEATYARRCFPCWDEPELKATFQLRLTIDDDHGAVANSAQVGRTTNADGRAVVEFAPTIVMSTYLVAFVAGPIEMTEPIDVDGVPLRVVHVPGKGHLTAYSLEVATFALRYFADYFGVPYPGDKVDLVAIPDFAFGAMENLGCITFREVLLLIDEASATQAELQRAADVINHELAHMWFGDLVTMSWWNGLWLNEAFATFMEVRCTDAFRPDWHRWVDFSLSRAEAYETDALTSTRPIEYEVISPADAEGMFDILTYEKGAAVVRMLEQFLGEDEFRAGIRRYIAENSYGNAETTDLWDAIEAETGSPVRRIMDSWIFQGGFPTLSAQLDGTTLTIAQEPTSYPSGESTGAADATDDTGDTNETEGATWSVPVFLRWPGADGDESQRVATLLEGPSTTIDLSAAPDWFLLNAGSAGFVRAAYTTEQLDALADVAIDALDPIERFAIVDDASAAMLAGRTSSIAFLNLIEAMSGESDRSVWQRLIGGLRQLDRLVDGEARERLQDIAHDILAPPLANLGLGPRPGDDDRSRQLRGDLIRALGTVANDPEIQYECKRTAAVGRRDPELVDPMILAAAVDVVASVGDQADFDDFVAQWREAATPQAEIRYLNALADFSDPALVARLHALALDGEIRSQNAPFVLGRSLANRDAGPQTWRFITEHWDRLNEMFASSAIVRMLAGLRTLGDATHAREAAEFFADHTVPSGGRTLAQILERQRVQVALAEREADRLAAFLLG